MLRKIQPFLAVEPSQASLDTVLDRVTRLRLLNGGVSGGKAIGKEIMLSVSDAQAISSLRDCLSIVEDRSTFDHCMCLGDYALELYAGRRRIATIGLHHGRSIRWNAWKYDAFLQDGPRLLRWLADQGATAPLEAYEEDLLLAEEYQQAARRWQAATPTCLQPFQDQMQALADNMVTFIPDSHKGAEHQGQAEDSSSSLAPLLRALETEYSDPEMCALALFKWFGSGKGPWSGYPSYEGVAERLLLEFPTQQLVAALLHQPLTPLHLEGAARYFAGYQFNTFKQDEAHQIPQEVKRKLLEYSQSSSDNDKIRRAKKALSV